MIIFQTCSLYQEKSEKPVENALPVNEKKTVDTVSIALTELKASKSASTESVTSSRKR